ncbi:MAG: hypothetical protein JWQ76_3431, partial [Ramlibacter sp.]|nr:hypothetical protein [Ramlibacter sp.]
KFDDQFLDLQQAHEGMFIGAWG